VDDFFDMDDSDFEPSDDFQENLFQGEGLDDLTDETNGVLPRKNGRRLGFESIVIASMIAGNAYETAIDKHRVTKKITGQRDYV
jgi:hypothetical protein